MAKKTAASMPAYPPPVTSPSPAASAPTKSKTSGAAKKKKKAAQLRQEKAAAAFDGRAGGQRPEIAMSGAYPEDEQLSAREPDDDPSDFPAPPTTAPASHYPSTGTQPAMPASLAAATRQTQEDLLATANDLYRQIESAAAAALAGHMSPSSLTGFGPGSQPTAAHLAQNMPPHPDDEAYWTSLPSHLRTFIRSALPLAAGLSPNSSPAVSTAAMPNLSTFAHATGVVGGPPGTGPGQVPQLSSEQMAAAAEQLARVVQSHDWGRAVSTAAQQQAAARGAAGLDGPTTMTTRDGATLSVSSGTLTGTIPLGSFTLPLPLHPHPDHPSAQGGDAGYYGGEAGDDVYEDDYLSEEERLPLTAVQSEPASGKKKNKKKKKKSNAALLASNIPAPPAAAAAPPPAPAPIARLPQPPPKASPAIQAVRERIAQGKPASVAHHRPAPTPAPTTKVPPVPSPIAMPPKGALGKTVAPPIPTPAVGPGVPRRPSGPPSEREKIRDFWLTLDQDERAALVKIEKDAVLRKMKEQQRHGCSCAVCGRKRSAIEQELEVLYDAYYDELENYAEAQRQYEKSGGRLPPPPGPGPFPGSVDVASTPAASAAPPTTGSTAKKPIPKLPKDHKNVKPKPGAPLSKKPAPTNKAPVVVDHNDPHHTHSPNCPHHHDGHHHHHGRGKTAATVEPLDDEEDEEDEEEYDDEEEDYDDEDEDDDADYEDDDDIPALEEVDSGKKAPANGTVKATGKTAAGPSEMAGFGNSLTVKGGILTVADDLLRNDGQKFLEMMESLADKRIQREHEATVMAVNGLDEEDDEDEYEDEEDEEDDDEDDVDDEDVDDEIITEEQRMEEGRRMFQIFAARMFEQRVLTAYREKVAQEKQAQLLRELEDEDRLAQERERKKVKDAAKKKEKKKAQKQQKDQDSARRAAEREAEEASVKAAEEARIETERRRQEEQRVKREAQRKAQEEERARREEEKRKKLEEEAKKRREKEERARVEKEARLAREKEERERKAKEEADRKAKLEAERKDREAKEAKAREEAERKAKEQAEKKEAEEAAKREVAKAAAAKLAAQNKAAAASSAATAGLKAHPPTQHRSPVGPRAVPPQATPAASPAAPPTPAPVPNPFPQQSRPIQIPRQASMGMGRPPSSTGPMFMPAPICTPGPSTFNAIPQRPPSAGFSSSLPGYGPPRPGSALPPPINSSANPFSSAQPGPSNLSPVMTRGFPAAPGSHRQNGVSPIGPPGPSSFPPTPIGPHSLKSPSVTAGALGSLHDDSQPLGSMHIGNDAVRKPSASAIGPIGPPSGHNRRRSAASENMFRGGIFSNGINPIGAPIGRRTNGSADDETPSGSASASPKSQPPSGGALGSSALLNDDDPVIEMPSRATPFGSQSGAPASSGSSFFSHGPFDTLGLGSGSGIWGSPAKNEGGWGAPAPRPPMQVPQPPSIQPTSADWVRRKAVAAYISTRAGEQWLPVGDVSVEMQRIYPDTRGTVDLKDMVNAILAKANGVNGGGDWQFNQVGPVLYTRWVTHGGPDELSGHPPGYPPPIPMGMGAIGARR